MELWIHWLNALWLLRPAFSRLRTFLWFVTCVAGITIRTELLGVTSIIRALGMDEKYYTNLLDTFHSRGINLDKLTQLWVKLVLKLFLEPVKVNGRLVLVGDGLKVPKCGKKMPAVKKLHQESESNTKPEYIMGHAFQAIGLLANAAAGVFSVPLSSRIHEGLVFSNRDKRTLLDKMVMLLMSLDLDIPYYFIADAYYANGKIIRGLLAEGNHLVTRAKTNAVAYEVAKQPSGTKKTRGRPKKYGKKIKLKSFFKDRRKMTAINSPIYKDKNVTILYRTVDLLWRPVGHVVRFVIVIHPTRGQCILMTTDLSLEPIDVIRLYGLRFKIEVSFKQAVRTIGAYYYHFWMMDMNPLKRNQGNQFLHKKSALYRRHVERKILAYHCFVQAGIIAQGLLQYLACVFPQQVWTSFGSWLRTIRPDVPPSEFVTAMALRNSYPEFLVVNDNALNWTKFICEKINLNRFQCLGNAA